MNKEIMRRNYEKTPKETLINILISSRETIQNRNKEIERLKKENAILKQTMCDESLLINENALLKDIIKEIREYIEKNTEEKKSWLNGIPDYRVFKGDTKELLEILDKENE